jgi:hypothetical protein
MGLFLEVGVMVLVVVSMMMMIILCVCVKFFDYMSLLRTNFVLDIPPTGQSSFENLDAIHEQVILRAFHVLVVFKSKERRESRFNVFCCAQCWETPTSRLRPWLELLGRG